MIWNAGPSPITVTGPATTTSGARAGPVVGFVITRGTGDCTSSKKPATHPTASRAEVNAPHRSRQDPQRHRNVLLDAIAADRQGDGVSGFKGIQNAVKIQ